MENGLYPPIEPYQSGMLAIGELHQIYWEQVGNPDGMPVLFLHGGPGAGSSPTHRRFFDPQFYRIILFDQRGCGRSKPVGELRENSTDHLIADIETLRHMLKIEQWLVFGGSWGSTLALAYGQTHPENCLGFILRGIFMCRPREIESFLYGMGRFFPEAWQKFSSLVPPDQRGDLLNAYLRLLNHPDPRVHVAAARAWARYEGACSTLLPTPDYRDESAMLVHTHAVFNRQADAATALPPPDQSWDFEARSATSLARLEAHYMAYDRFLKNHDFFAHMAALRPLPAAIIQGRYDLVCPPETAWELSQAWPEAKFVMIPDAGHSSMEFGIRNALIAETERFKGILLATVKSGTVKSGTAKSGTAKSGRANL
ncbi:MAG: prolyl aminopeptidase [Candidatus Symbiobacter sp.]|nr:prolyl aminopeptidase [Candidatus Symbiobacter sp.]